MADNYDIGIPRQETQLDPNGRGFMSAWEYPVTVTSGPSQGARFTVTIPGDQHNADYVHNTISAEVANLDAIKSR